MNRRASNRPKVQSVPLAGGYYWCPLPTSAGHTWELVTCHDLKVWDAISHRELWPYVLEYLAAAWGKDAEVLKRRLGDNYTGLPRGRITHPTSGYLIAHGEDAPVRDWLSIVKQRFRLNRVKPLSDDHERMLREDLKAVEDALGVILGLDRAV